MITITLLGATTVATASGTVLSAGDLGGVKPRQILQILALEAGTPVAKDRLADLLWEGAPPKSYVATLESYVCVLRRALGLRGGRRSLLATTTHGYALDPTAVSVDVVQLRRLLAEAAAAAPGTSLDLTEQALAHATAPLLAGEPYARWAQSERDLLDRQLAAGCARAAGQACAGQEWERATRLAAAAVEHDPLAELPVRHLMTALWHSGQRFEALRAYAGLRAAMVEELGAEPGPATHELYLQILRDDTTSGQGRGRSELRLLLGLLRQTLESMPGIELPPSDSALTTAAARVLEVA